MVVKVRLFDLALACDIFQGFEKGYGDAYKEFLNDTNQALDMHDDRHRMALLTWLNKWRCRIPKKSFEEISEKLLTWFGKYKRSFPQEGKRLLDLSGEEIIRVAEIYKGLLEIKFIDATIASKILFALRRDIYPIWDDAMRKEYSTIGCSAYSDYMKQSKEELQELSEECQSKDTEISELPRLLGRERESLLKLLDEYHFVFMTKKLSLPSVRDYEDWYKWAK